MESRERESQQQKRPVSHSLSSLIVRPSDSEGGGSDYEPGEVRRENPSHGDSPPHLRSRSNRFPDKNQGYGMHAGSVSPFRQRKVDHHGMRAGSFSPLQKRNVNKPNGILAGSRSPLHQRNVDKHCVMRAGSVSPLRQRTVDKHCVIRADSVSPLHKRSVDSHYGMRAGSILPSHQRNVDNHYGMHAGSISPIRQRKVDRHYDSGFNHPGGPRHGHGRGRGIRGGRGLERFRDASPSFGRGRGRRSFERGFDRPDFGPLQFRDEGIRNNPNVSPREGDWICSDPSCGNLNFARRAFCNNCNKLRFGPGGGGPGGSPRGRYVSPPSPHGPWPHIPGPSMDRGPERDMNEFDSPPRDWGRDGPRAVGKGIPPPRRGGRIPGYHIPRERPNYREEEFRERGKFDRAMPPEWGYRGRGNGDFFHERRRYDGRDEHRLPSPPPPPPYRDQWVCDGRDRSRSPIRGGPKDYHRGPYMGRGRGRGRDDRRAMVRMRVEAGY